MEFNQLKETILNHLISQQKYLLNTKQAREALEKDKIIYYGKCSGVIGQKLL